MLRAGATATMEAWSTDEKPNLSWSHPWASAPASAVVWGLFGMRPAAPGWGALEGRVGFVIGGWARFDYGARAAAAALVEQHVGARRHD